MSYENRIIVCTVLFWIGVFVVFSAIGSYFNVNYIVSNQIYKNILLENNSKAYNFWLKPPAKIIRKYYFFDVKNSRDIENGKNKPKLVQRGPYTYSEVIEKNNITFKSKQKLNFRPVISLFFEPSLSVGNESDMITFLNITALVSRCKRTYKRPFIILLIFKQGNY